MLIFTFILGVIVALLIPLAQFYVNVLISDLRASRPGADSSERTRYGDR